MDRSLGLVDFTRDDPNPDSIPDDLRNILWRNVLVPGCGHLRFGRQIDPQLESPHQTVFLLGHLGVDDPTSCGHPLNAPGNQISLVTDMVPMFHASGEHIGHSFESAMRVVRESGDVVTGLIGLELIE
jgi:hypothetical protein